MNENIVSKIKELKKEKNAIILAHFYQPPEIQAIADAVGDSYYLSEIARDCEEEVIVFCGVQFMGESAKIMSPEKTVLMSSKNPGCIMAAMASEKAVVEMKKKYPEALTVCYINSTAEVKAHCDVSVTSSSALNILGNVENKQILFLPDRNLGGYIAEHFPEKEFILWDGCCVIHDRVDEKQILELKEEHPEAKVLVHPECRKEIRDMGDFVGSTSGIIKYATNDDAQEFIVATEEGILYELERQNPDKKFYFPGGKGVIKCRDMKKTTLESVYNTLLNMENEVIVEENIRVNALNALLNMHKLSEK